MIEQIIYQDGVRDVLDIRVNDAGWWLWSTWDHVHENIRNLCLKHAAFRTKCFPRFARDCCEFRITCWCFHCHEDTWVELVTPLHPPGGDGSLRNPYII